MAGFLTDHANNRVLDGLFGSVPLNPPSTLYFGLSKGNSGKAGVVYEPSGGSYARVALSNDTSRFPAATAGTKTNAVAISFPTPTSDWGQVLSVFIADAPVGGNVLAMADLTTPKLITLGSPAPSIAVGALFFSHT